MWARSRSGEAFQIISISLAFFACFQVDWAIASGRLLGPVVCLPHKDGGISLSVLPKDTTSKLAGLLSTTIGSVLSAKQGSSEFYFLKSFGMTRLGK